MNGLSALARYARERPPPVRERCELCGVAIADDHRHVVDLEKRSLCCSCPACALLFDQDGGRFRRVPERVLRAPPIPAVRWNALGVPVKLAFLFFNSRLSRWTASYPGVAGAIESDVAPEKWDELAREYPLLKDIKPDVEALLVFQPECFIVPIDACYELVGICRQYYRGFDGGDEFRGRLAAFFDGLRRRSTA